MGIERRKTDLTRIFRDGEYYMRTIGNDFSFKIVETRKGEQVKLQILSISGLDRSKPVREIQYKGAIGALFVYFAKKYYPDTYDLSRLKEFFTEYEKARVTNTPMMLVIIPEGPSPNIPPSESQRGSRVITNVATDLPTGLSNEEKAGIIRLVGRESGIKVVLVDPYQAGGMTFALAELAADMMDWTKSPEMGAYAESTTGSDEYAAFFKVVVTGNDRGFIFNMPLSIPEQASSKE